MNTDTTTKVHLNHPSAAKAPTKHADRKSIDQMYLRALRSISSSREGATAVMEETPVADLLRRST